MISPEPNHSVPVCLVSTGDDEARLTRLETGFRRVLEPLADLRTLRLGRVDSLRIAYHNAARLMDRPDTLLIFVHQDVEPVTSDVLSTLPDHVSVSLRPLVEHRGAGPPWWQTLLRLSTRDDFGFAGVAGSRELQHGKAWWQHDPLTGMVLHRRKQGIRVNAYGPWSRALVLDGLCLICRTSTMLELPPAQADTGHFHFYDLDLCLQAHGKGLRNWTLPLLLLHDSGGASVNDPRWQNDRGWFEAKHRDQLPATVPEEPLPDDFS